MSECEIEKFYVTSKAPVRLGGSSKGAQDKYFAEGHWYKQDSVGYEGPAEVLASRVARTTNSTVSQVDYSPVQIVTKTAVFRGCKSLSFLGEGDVEITLARLLEKRLGVRYRSQDFPEGVELLESAVECLKQLDSTNSLVDQLSCLLQLDRLVMNVDRHLHNIVLVNHDGAYSMISFDYGDSLASDITYDFDEGMSSAECLASACARPFSSSFDVQCDLLRSYSSFSLKAVSSTISVSDLKSIISPQVFTRMLEIIACNFNKYLGVIPRFE